MKHTLLIILAGLIALGSGFLMRTLNNTSPVQTTRADLFATELPDLTGQNHRLKEWQGKVLVINFWATWCPPCLHEIPAFIALQNQYAAQNVQFIGIAVDEKQAVDNFNAKMKFNYPVLLAPDIGMDIARQWGNVIESVPFTVVIDAQGKILHRQLGEMTKIELQTILQVALNKNKP